MKNVKPLLSVIIMIIAITFFISPDDSVAANAAFEKSKYVFYEGNEEKLLLTCNGKEDYFGNWDYYSDDFFSLESSNESVATISYDGVISCRSTGETVITFSCGQVQAKTKIKVKSGGCTLSCDDVTMYAGETTSIRMKNKKNKAASYNCNISKAGDSYFWLTDLWYSFDDKGNFTFEASQPGEYTIEYILYDDAGKRFSKTGHITVLPCGLESYHIAILKGTTAELNFVNADSVSVKPSYWINNYEYIINTINEGDDAPSVFDSDSMTMSGVFAGSTCYDIEFTTPSGYQVCETLYVYTTDPKYVPADEYIMGGDWYKLEIYDASLFSDIKVTPADSETLDVKIENGDAYIMPLKSGTHEISISVDGMEFTDTVRCIVLMAPSETIRIIKGKSFSLDIGDIPDDVNVKYSSDNKKIAKVSKKGKVTGTGYGTAVITATVGAQSVYVAVNVGTPVATKAVNYAEKQIGKSEYSQDKRMKEGYFDCSSLAWRSFASQKCYLGGSKTYAPTAADLAKWLEANDCVIEYGAPEDLSKLVVGDLIFSTSGGNNGRFMQIDHVAVYDGARTWQQCISSNMNYYDYYDEYTAELCGMIVHAGGSGGGVYLSAYPGYGKIVMTARPKTP